MVCVCMTERQILLHAFFKGSKAKNEEDKEKGVCNKLVKATQLEKTDTHLVLSLDDVVLASAVLHLVLGKLVLLPVGVSLLHRQVALLHRVVVLLRQTLQHHMSRAMY